MNAIWAIWGGRGVGIYRGSGAPIAQNLGKFLINFELIIK